MILIDDNFSLGRSIKLTAFKITEFGFYSFLTASASPPPPPPPPQQILFICLVTRTNTDNW